MRAFTVHQPTTQEGLIKAWLGPPMQHRNTP